MSSSPSHTRRQKIRRIVRKVLLVWIVLLVALSAILLIRTATFDSKQVDVAKVEVTLPMPDEMAQRLAVAIRFPTISDTRAVFPAQAFYDLHEHLRVSFPQVHESLVRINVSNYSLLYTWKGTSPELPAILLAAHLDVVPPESKQWQYPPFDGVVDERYIHGRGTLDDKVSVLGILEAVEQLSLIHI